MPKYPVKPGLLAQGEPSDNERIKAESKLLRGSISEDLGNPVTGGFTDDNFMLIRFHGMYQQDDRDLRQERAEQKLEPLHNVMLRARLPGGVITPRQWLAIDRFAGEKTLYGSIRLTTRQTFQFHGVLKPTIKPMHQLLNSIGIDSIATAGDVNRNVLCTPNPIASKLHKDAWLWASRISEHLLPKTRAYAEVWLDQEKIETTEEEPILGKTYLPRKFKTAVVVPPQNDVDVHANDLSFIAIAEGDELVGFNVTVGGGLAMTHGDTDTYPRTADELGYIPLKHTLAVAEHIVGVQRDYGNRSNRKNAKTKYTIDRIGLDTFRKLVEERTGFLFEPIRPYKFTSRGDRFGWIRGIDERDHLTLFIENGRILDYPHRSLKSGLAEIARIHEGDFRITANQNIIVAGVAPKNREVIERIAIDNGLIDPKHTAQRKASMACVSLPTCPLAMAEAERYLPELVADVENLLKQHQLSDQYIVLRVSGCPNGCSRAMLAEVALIGRGPGKYNLYLGGNRTGSRIPRLYLDNVSTSTILETLNELIKRWSEERLGDEGFGDFLIRSHIVDPVRIPSRDFHNLIAQE
ncbi:MAG: assimilatory sulfite reductase (NADPH) hemoprotein subunit [Pseudomonadota bacterium]